MFCPSCGGELEGGLTDCPTCEQPIPPDLLAQELLGLVLEGHYRVEEFISRGGMGSVYRGVDLSLSRPVAIKFLDERFHSDREVVSRFHREAVAAAALDHPNVVPIFSVGRSESHHYFVMKFVDGGTIARLVREGGALPLGDALSIAIQVCQGLEHIHGSGYVHRDIKPTNIMVSQRGHAYILDFGILRLLSSDLTQTGLVAGTPEYMSPEQARDAKSADARSDLYSLGVMLFEMLTGRPPFAADTAIDLLMKHLNEPPPRVTDFAPTLPPELDGVVLRALDKDPFRRYATAAQMADALQRVLTASGEAVAGRYFGPHGPMRPASEKLEATLALGAKEAQEAGVKTPAPATPDRRDLRATLVRGESTATEPPRPGRLRRAWVPALAVLLGGIVTVLALTLRPPRASTTGPGATRAGTAATAVSAPGDAGVGVGALPPGAVSAAVDGGTAPPLAPSRSVAGTRVGGDGGAPARSQGAPPSGDGGASPAARARRARPAPSVRRPTRAAQARRLAARRLAALEVSSRPSGADVYVGRRRLGRTPLKKAVATGTYLLKVSKSGYGTYRRKVALSSLEPLSVVARLKALPARLTVVIQQGGKLSYAHVALDGRTYERVPVVDRKVRPGRHRIEVRRAGFATQRRTVHLAAGAHERVVFDLRRD